MMLTVLSFSLSFLLLASLVLFCSLHSLVIQVLSYWGPAKKLLATPGFLDTLKEYDKDNIKPAIIKKIQKNYINHEENGPNFLPARVEKASFAACGMCKYDPTLTQLTLQVARRVLCVRDVLLWLTCFIINMFIIIIYLPLHLQVGPRDGIL